MSEPITRYWINAINAGESELGEWVKYEDHERIVADLREDLSVARQSLYEVAKQRNDAIAYSVKLDRLADELRDELATYLPR